MAVFRFEKMSSCDNTTVDINDVDKLCLVCLGKLNKMFSLSDKLEIEDNSDGLVIYNALNAVVSVQVSGKLAF